MTDLERKIAETVAQQRREDEAGLAAVSDALPGPLAVAFNPKQDIKVGNYVVRPFYDGDIEFLKLLKHPMHDMIQDGLNGKPVDVSSLSPRGPQAWQIYWILANEFEFVDSVFEKSGIPGAEKASKVAFAKKQIGELVEFMHAATDQMGKYWSTVIGYSNEPQSEDGKEPAKAAANPTSSAAPSTG